MHSSREENSKEWILFSLVHSLDHLKPNGINSTALIHQTVITLLFQICIVKDSISPVYGFPRGPLTPLIPVFD